MISFNNINNALKQAYLPVVSEQLDNQIDLFFKNIVKTGKDVWGKQIIVLIKSNGNKFIQIKSELSNIYCSIEISDKALRCSQNSTGALVNLLNDEIEYKIKETQKHIRDAFYNEDKKPDYLDEQTKYEQLKLNGLNDLFSDNKILYGVDRTKYEILNPYKTTIDEFDVDKIRSIIDNHSEDADFIVMSNNNKRKFLNWLDKNKLNVKTVDGIYDKPIIQFDIGMNLITAPIDDNSIYVLNSKDFIMHQLVDWEWLSDENGNIVRMQFDKPVYKATLVKYANILCHNPSKQIKITIKNK